MHLDLHMATALALGPERETIEAVSEQLAAVFEIAAPRERSALCVASSNAGSATAVRFWSEARRVGLSLASPALFPWCLANATCGALARRFAVTGPNFTHLGEAEALLSALDSVAEQFELRRVDAAVIVALDFAPREHELGYLHAFRLVQRSAGYKVSAEPTLRAVAGSSLRACASAFEDLLSQLDDGTLSSGTVTDGCRSFRIDAAAR